MKGKLIGIVFNYFEKVSVVAIELNGSLKIGDTIRIVGGENDFNELVNSIQINGKNIKTAKKGDKIGVKITGKAGKGYKVYKVI